MSHSLITSKDAHSYFLRKIQQQSLIPQIEISYMNYKMSFQDFCSKIRNQFKQTIGVVNGVTEHKHCTNPSYGITYQFSSSRSP